MVNWLNGREAQVYLSFSFFIYVVRKYVIFIPWVNWLNCREAQVYLSIEATPYPQVQSHTLESQAKSTAFLKSNLKDN